MDHDVKDATEALKVTAKALRQLAHLVENGYVGSLAISFATVDNPNDVQSNMFVVSAPHGVVLQDALMSLRQGVAELTQYYITERGWALPEIEEAEDPADRPSPDVVKFPSQIP